MAEETATTAPAPAAAPAKAPSGDPGFVQEITVDTAGPANWQEALALLDGGTAAAPAKKAPPAPAQPTPVPAPAAQSTPKPVVPGSKEGMSRYEQLCKTPSMEVKKDDFKVIDELSAVMSHVNSALNLLKKFEEKHPYLIAPNIFRMWEDNLKETSTAMFREFHNMRNGVQKKTYEKKYVCPECHSVFLVPIPGGVCDECKGRRTKGLAPY